MSLYPISVVIASKDVITRKGIATTIVPAKHIQVAAIINSIDELEHACCLHQPDVILMGASLPDIDNRKAYRYIASRFPCIPVIIIVNEYDAETIITMKTAGEFAWLYTSAAEEEIIRAITGVHEGTYENTVYNGYNTHAARHKPTATLTPKQQKILPYICRGFSAKEIGAETRLSPRTVQKHKDNIFQKLGSRSIAAMVVYAIKNNIPIQAIVYSIVLLFCPEADVAITLEMV